VPSKRDHGPPKRICTVVGEKIRRKGKSKRKSYIRPRRAVMIALRAGGSGERRASEVEENQKRRRMKEVNNRNDLLAGERRRSAKSLPWS